MLRLTDNPISRYPKDRPLDEDLGRWAVAHVKSRQEKAFAADLFIADVPYYLPLIENRTRRREREGTRNADDELDALLPSAQDKALKGEL